MAELINVFITIMAVYLLLGVTCALFLFIKGLVKIDSSADGTSVFFKILVFPGICVFWPLFLSNWIKGKE